MFISHNWNFASCEGKTYSLISGKHFDMYVVDEILLLDQMSCYEI